MLKVFFLEKLGSEIEIFCGRLLLQWCVSEAADQMKSVF